MEDGCSTVPVATVLFFCLHIALLCLFVLAEELREQF